VTCGYPLTVQAAEPTLVSMNESACSPVIGLPKGPGRKTSTDAAHCRTALDRAASAPCATLPLLLAVAAWHPAAASDASAAAITDATHRRMVSSCPAWFVFPDAERHPGVAGFPLVPR
jgi:hypothetical protein